ncbi:hypothetical protein FT663_01292 [Candidozyma haemuli var. vulneris]|uniref:DNA polymerase delta subunit 3 n=1 Tax=Candidozyma haemuli TaxID=45357 RepID=A0A2V1AZT3_9ASCO|nr:hypothetical protein CXQ85_004969 [[Candida] haemuloni]KAF3992157.1 hypothetical protein FT662_01327 [[Candida] haemuloni var. vulneris]KAF3994602.1 hypothetical protein FT663_01292 [[Candida] haemuloni var. vulneris]PVH22401.1 hypothetical protein CXQ85_004969 [[Candida] haemuloni]
MTMDITPDQVRYIAEQLESHSVSFNTVSRDLNLHTAQAKQVLYAYYSSNKEKLNALYVVTGVQGSKTVVKVVDNVDDGVMSEVFDKVNSKHIFSISQNKFSFSTSDIALEELRRPVDLENLDVYYEQGMIRGRPVKKASVKEGFRPRAEPAKPKPKPEPKKEAAPPPQAESKPKLQYQSRKEKPQPSLLSNYVSRKDEKKQKDAEKSGSTVDKRSRPDQGSGYQYKSRKLEKQQPKERVIVSHDTEDPEDEEPARKAPTTKTTDLNSLFLDDLSDFSDNDDTAKEAAQEKEEPIMVEEAAQHDPSAEEEKGAKATVAPSLPQDSSLRSLTSKSPTPQVAEPQDTAKDAPQEPETTVDEDGYIVTKKAPEPKKEPPKREVKKPAPATKKPTSSKKKSDGTKKQASLMSFFDRR